MLWFFFKNRPETKSDNSGKASDASEALLYGVGLFIEKKNVVEARAISVYITEFNLRWET